MADGSFIVQRKGLSERERWLQMHCHFRIRNGNLLAAAKVHEALSFTLISVLHVWKQQPSGMFKVQMSYRNVVCGTMALCQPIGRRFSWKLARVWQLFPLIPLPLSPSKHVLAHWDYKHRMSCPYTNLLLQTSDFRLVESRWEQIVLSCCLFIMQLL